MAEQELTTVMHTASFRGRTADFIMSAIHKQFDRLGGALDFIQHDRAGYRSTVVGRRYVTDMPVVAPTPEEMIGLYSYELRYPLPSAR